MNSTTSFSKKKNELSDTSPSKKLPTFSTYLLHPVINNKGSPKAYGSFARQNCRSATARSGPHCLLCLSTHASVSYHRPRRRAKTGLVSRRWSTPAKITNVPSCDLGQGLRFRIVGRPARTRDRYLTVDLQDVYNGDARASGQTAAIARKLPLPRQTLPVQLNRRP